MTSLSGIRISILFGEKKSRSTSRGSPFVASIRRSLPADVRRALPARHLEGVELQGQARLPAGEHLPDRPSRPLSPVVERGGDETLRPRFQTALREEPPAAHFQVDRDLAVPGIEPDHRVFRRYSSRKARLRTVPSASALPLTNRKTFQPRCSDGT